MNSEKKSNRTDSKQVQKTFFETRTKPETITMKTKKVSVDLAKFKFDYEVYKSLTRYPLSKHRYLKLWLAIAALLFFIFAPPSYSQTHKAALTWDVNTEPDIAGYNAYIGESPGQYSFMQTVQHPVTRSDFWQLQTGETYYFAVTAFDQVGNESGFSIEVSLTITTQDKTPPAIPGGVGVQQLIETELVEFFEKHAFKIRPDTTGSDN